MKKQEKSGAQALVDSLAKAGTEVLFGYPGGQCLDIFNCLPEAPFQFVLGRHEQGCVHMADGYARATGKVGVCLVTSGPGATNTVTGLATANMDGVPIVCITGQVPSIISSSTRRTSFPRSLPRRSTSRRTASPARL